MEYENNIATFKCECGEWFTEFEVMDDRRDKVCHNCDNPDSCIKEVE